MEYKIKVKPEDFQVREISSLPLTDRGSFGVFKLKKQGWNTVDLLKKISRQFFIPPSRISYGGKKDRHALTEQLITIEKPPKGFHIKEKNYSLKLIGFSKEPMQPRHIEGNHFTITIRSISTEGEQYLQEPLKKIERDGLINYFDDQRFGSFDSKQGFIGEKIIKEHYNGAVKIYLTHIHPEDKKEAKERKKKLFENWGNWEQCLNLAKTEFEKFSFAHLKDNPRDFLSLIRKIPKEDISMFFSCYQSFLWNETVRRLILSMTEEEAILSHRGIAGDYLFFSEMETKKREYLENLKIPTASSKVTMPDKLTESIYNALLKERDVKPSMFNLRKIRHAFFKSVEREVLIKPQQFEYEIREDEIYEGKRKLILKFILPRGSYATMLIKRLFAKKLKKGG
ncbi:MULTISPECIES: tRNA pseudouridine(13) synthase TruD [Thermodesulfovibrio]|uniref:tRNA pseudouridine(13) synthase TruD n=1 Tax=Thermodesulfovibrio TaxID=28261 RepID=UPI002631B43D|nr:tRNA pseudouridine(13) synthase TruD [Thermodesulfovibrio sp.]